MTDVADLQIRVTSLEATVAERRLDGMARAGGKAERATDGLMRTMGRFVSVAAAGAAVMAGFAKVISVQREFDVLNAGLVTATGNAENAAVAFQAIQDFASTTPYDLQQATEAFTKLVNYGLDPSERALTAYGNTAAAMGKDLGEMVQAVANATTGEMEMLKSFGIKAKQDGDRITFIFRGVSTTVRNTAAEIETYMKALGENEFAGAMEARMKTLDGAFSNLGDEWDKLFLNLSQSGLGDAIGDGVREAIGVLEELNDYVASGQFEGHVGSMAEAFGPWVEDAGRATDMIWGFISDLNSDIEGANPELQEALERVWRDFPANVRALVQLATTYFAANVEELKIRAQGLADAFRAIFNDDTIQASLDRQNAALARNANNYRDAVDWILADRDATVDAQKDKERAADAARAAYEKERAAREKQTGDRLAGFRIGGDPDGADPKATKAAESEAKRRQTQFRSLVEDLRTEEEALAASYQERVTLVEQFTSAESALRAELMDRLEAWRAQEADGISESKGRELEQIRRSLLTEEQALQESYERRRQVVLDSVAVSEDARQRMLEQLDRQHSEDVAREQAERQAKRDRLFQDFMSEADLMRAFRDQRIEEQRQAYAQELIDWEEFQRNKAAIEQQYHEASAALTRQGMIQSLDIYGGMIGGLGQMFAQFAQSQGRNSEKMFRISKALNIAQAVMATAAGIMEAQRTEQSQYQRIAEQVRIAALGAVQVAAISSQQYSGAYDKGGYIPSGKFGIVGERGMELVSGPANVTSREETSRMLRRAAEGGGGGDVTVSISVVVDNGGNASSKTDVKGGDDAEQARKAKEFGQMLDGRVRDVIVKEQRQGGLLSSVR